MKKLKSSKITSFQRAMRNWILVAFLLSAVAVSFGDDSTEKAEEKSDESKEGFDPKYAEAVSFFVLHTLAY